MPTGLYNRRSKQFSGNLNIKKGCLHFKTAYFIFLLLHKQEISSKLIDAYRDLRKIILAVRDVK
jgi:hypothetical protein